MGRIAIVCGSAFFILGVVSSANSGSLNMSEEKNIQSEGVVLKLPLWENDIPYFKELAVPEHKGEDGWVEDIAIPDITVFLPPEPKRNGSVVVICPGGGYAGLCMEKEGYEVARWLNTFGTTGVVLKYRCKPFHHPVPLTDAQRALRLTRFHCPQWGLDPSWVGILGFSAAGHLASTVGTHFDGGKPDAVDPVERQGCRPDFMILVYPVISMTDEITHHESQYNLLGPDPSPGLVQLLSNELQVTKDTPPTFLAHASNDEAVSPLNSVCFYRALLQAGVSGEMHIYPTGGHGFGMRRSQNRAPEDWPKQCKAWMEWLRVTKGGSAN